MVFVSTSQLFLWNFFFFEGKLNLVTVNLMGGFGFLSHEIFIWQNQMYLTWESGNFGLF